MQIITGRTGEPHVYAADDAELYRLFLGDGDFCLTSGARLELRRTSPTEIRIMDGSLIMQGRLSKIRPADGYDALEIENGTVGYKRVDLVVAEYNQLTEEKQKEEGGQVITYTDVIETVELKIVKGTPHPNNYIEPPIITGNMDAGETHQMKLWGVKLDGINASGETDHRVFLETTPIQTALEVANQSVEQIQAEMQSFQEDIYAYIDTLYNTIIAGFRAAWKKTLILESGDASTFIDIEIEGYTYNETDIVEVYLEGLRLEPSEYIVDVTNGLKINLTSGTFVGQMEVVIFRLSEGE